jgi:hypothetical protein
MKDVFEGFKGESKGELDRSVAASLSSLNVAAKASMVNRTHRVVRERAKQMSARKSRLRSLWAPLLVCGSLVVILVTAVWSLLDQYELNPTGIPDPSEQFAVLLLWFLPVSGALLALVWLRRAQNKRSGSEVAR